MQNLLLIGSFLILLFIANFEVYEAKLKTVKVGNLQLSRIGCGTWSWGNKLLWGYDESQDDTIKEAYDYVTSQGLNWFDTADSYGTGALEGQSEKLLGQFSTDKLSKKNKVYFATKLAPFPWRIGSSSMINACSKSSERLNRNVDILQLHWRPPLGWQETEYLDAFAELAKSQQVTQLGVSNYGPKKLAYVQDYMEEKHGLSIKSNQVQFSLLSRYPESTGLLDVAKERGIQMIGYSPLALGLLSDRYNMDNLPSGPRSFIFKEYLPVIDPLLNELRSIAKYKKKTVPQIALNWTLQKGALALVGIRSKEQGVENIKADSFDLSKAEVEALDIAAKSCKKQLVQNNFQTD